MYNEDDEGLCAYRSKTKYSDLEYKMSRTIAFADCVCHRIRIQKRDSDIA